VERPKIASVIPQLQTVGVCYAHSVSRILAKLIKTVLTEHGSDLFSTTNENMCQINFELFDTYKELNIDGLEHIVDYFFDKDCVRIIPDKNERDKQKNAVAIQYYLWSITKHLYGCQGYSTNLAAKKMLYCILLDLPYDKPPSMPVQKETSSAASKSKAKAKPKSKKALQALKEKEEKEMIIRLMTVLENKYSSDSHYERLKINKYYKGPDELFDIARGILAEFKRIVERENIILSMFSYIDKGYNYKKRGINYFFTKRLPKWIPEVIDKGLYLGLCYKGIIGGDIVCNIESSHAVTIKNYRVGTNGNKNSFDIVNSFGPTWGDGTGQFTVNDGHYFDCTAFEPRLTQPDVLIWWVDYSESHEYKYDGDYDCSLYSSIFMKDGVLYCGHFKNVKDRKRMVLTGDFEFLTEQGLYSGSLVNGKISGKGVMYYKDGTSYYGLWENNEPVVMG